MTPIIQATNWSKNDVTLSVTANSVPVIANIPVECSAAWSPCSTSSSLHQLASACPAKVIQRPARPARHFPDISRSQPSHRGGRRASQKATLCRQHLRQILRQPFKLVDACVASQSQVQSQQGTEFLMSDEKQRQSHWRSNRFQRNLKNCKSSCDVRKYALTTRNWSSLESQELNWTPVPNLCETENNAVKYDVLWHKWDETTNYTSTSNI